MRVLIYLLFLASQPALAYSESQDLIVKAIVISGQDKNYPQDEIKWAIRSNIFEVPDGVICAYLPTLIECQQ